MQKISSPRDCVSPLIKHADRREVFGVITLNGNNEIMAVKVLFQGTVNLCPVLPREIFRYAIMKDAVNIIVFHNHPSGNPEPSEKDFRITEQLIEGSKILEVQLLDHIIITKTSYYSFLEHGQLFQLDDKNSKVASN